MGFHSTDDLAVLRQTYMSSSELRYILKLSGRQLLPVPNVVDHTSISKRLQLSRNKAYAWFKFKFHSFEQVSSSEESFSAHTFVADEHLYS
ncbi:hypothetical protein BDR06DRAFT_961671 [Suillus hirtellus]|nr:hypothetical protein BDR06DRAFT_961671 [Suillus hirtellus]